MVLLLGRLHVFAGHLASQLAFLDLADLFEVFRNHAHFLYCLLDLRFVFAAQVPGFDVELPVVVLLHFGEDVGLVVVVESQVLLLIEPGHFVHNFGIAPFLIHSLLCLGGPFG